MMDLETYKTSHENQQSEFPTRSDTNQPYSHRIRLEARDLDLRRKGIVCVAKTEALISFAVTAKLVCAFVFAYACCWFSD